MSIADQFLAEIKHEAAITRKYLERVPQDKFDWQPHEKSMTLGRLASHLAEINGWVEMTIKETEMKFDPATFKPYLANSPAELVATLDKGLTSAEKALAGVPDEALGVIWSLKAGDKVLFTMPRAAVLRGMMLNHTVHHRAQLGVYLRLLGVPVPATYGPSADEQ
ncbi:MAG: DinB family protein [Candidatus Sumerlaeaceae bacterium]|nr:DinB family protein [Candidatus Sumerlaeaceae bacterium]